MPGESIKSQWRPRVSPVVAALLGMLTLVPAVLSETSDSARTALLPYRMGCNDGAECQTLILVHGINGTKSDTEAGNCGLYQWLEPTNQAIEDDCNWEPLLRYFRDTDLWGRLKIYIFRYESNKASTTIDLGKQLLNGMEDKNLNDVVVIAHSMGGLVTRMMMEEPGGYDRVKALITLATPHHGTPLANREWRNKLADKSDVGVEDLIPAQKLNVFDRVFWHLNAGSPHLVRDSSRPNRSDLVWSNRDGLFNPYKSKDPNSWWEENTLLLRLASSEVGRKIITYGGVLENARIQKLGVNDLEEIFKRNPHVFLEGFAYELRNTLHVLIPSDGLVPLDSALFAGNRYVALRRSNFVNYDHLDMLGNKPSDARAEETNSHLFETLTKDLSVINTFGGVAPRLSSVEIEPFQSIPSGTIAQVHWALLNVHTERRQIQVVIKDLSTNSCLLQQAIGVIGLDPSFSIEWRVPVVSSTTNLSLRAEVWPVGDERGCRGQDPLLDTLSKTLQVRITPPPLSGTAPTILLATTAEKREFLRGDVVTLRVTEKTLYDGHVGSLPLVFRFIWRDGPDGRRFLMEGPDAAPREVSGPQPVRSAGPLLNWSYNLPPMPILEGTAAGEYIWKAAIQVSEVFNPANFFAEAPPLSYRVRDADSPTPSVVFLRTDALYRAGSTMVIHYETSRGSNPVQHDLMLRLTSRATAKEYYFYDDPTDTNRWIHTTPKAMKTMVPTTGSFQIPAPGDPAILIENRTPSGSYDMLMYFSEVGKNTPTGTTATGFFALETSTPEGGCFVATAAYGSAFGPAVNWLREFRDVLLLPSALGRRFVQQYYQRGPAAAAIIQDRPLLKKAARVVLWPLAGAAWLAVHAGFIWAISLILVLASGLTWTAYRGPRFARAGLLVLLLAGIAAAAEIRGHVIRAKPFPAPVSNLVVDLAPTGKKTVSGADGSFRFADVSPGSYTITASGPGYLKASQTLQVQTVSESLSMVIPVLMTGSRIYEYHLPHTAESDGWWTFFALTNPNPTFADIIFTAYAANGERLGVSDKLTQLAINHFAGGKPSSFFPAEVAQKAAWYRVQSSGPLAGVEMFGHQVGTLAAFSLPMPDGEMLYLPHVAHDVQWWTGVSFVSAGVKSSSLHLEARGADGGLIGRAARPTRMQPGEKVVDTLDSFFGWDFPIDIKWAGIRSDSPLTGFELFGTRDLRMLAAVPALSRGGSRLVFPHIQTGASSWTAIALLNISKQSIEPILKAYSPAGELLATSRTGTLAPGERTVGTIQEYFSLWPANVVYVEVTAADEFVGFELVGQFDPPLFGGLAGITEFAKEIAYPFVDQSNSWSSLLTVVNLSSAATQVEWSAYSSKGSRLARRTVALPARGASTRSVASIFGSTPSGTVWVKASSTNAMLAGHVQLTRTASGEFTNYPAHPVVTAEQVGVVAEISSITANSQTLLEIMSSVRLTPHVQGGFRVSWDESRNKIIQQITTGQVKNGDIVVSINGTPIHTSSDLRSLALKYRDYDSVRLGLKSPDGRVREIQLRNPLQ